MIVSVGIDMIEVSRIRETLARTPRFASRVFTEKERPYCDSKGVPAAHHGGVLVRPAGPVSTDAVDRRNGERRRPGPCQADNRQQEDTEDFARNSHFLSVVLAAGGVDGRAPTRAPLSARLARSDVEGNAAVPEGSERPGRP